MKSQIRALAWEFFRKGLVTFVSLLSGLTLLMIIIRGGVAVTARAQADAPELAFGFYCFFLEVQLLLYCAGLAMLQSDTQSRRWGFPAWLMRLPVATPWLVLTQLLAGMAAAAVLGLITAALFGYFFGVTPPLLAPAVMLAAATGCILCLTWGGISLHAVRLLPAAWVIWRFMRWSFLYYGKGAMVQKPGAELWVTPPMLELAGLLGAVGLCYPLAVAGVAFDRRGENDAFAVLQRFMDRFSERQPLRSRRFASPQAAQLWLEWRQKGMWLPITLAVQFLIMAALLTYYGFSPEDTLEWCIFFSLFPMLFTSIPIGILIGRCSLNARRDDLDLLRATRPLNDRDLAFAVLRCGGLSVLLSWGICLAAPLGYSLWHAAWGEGYWIRKAWLDFAQGCGFRSLGLWGAPLIYLINLFLSWALLAFFALPAMTGRSRSFAYGTLLLILVFIFFSIIQLTMTPAQREVLANVFYQLVGSLSLGVTLIGIWQAGRRKLLGPLGQCFGILFCLLSVVVINQIIGSQGRLVTLFLAGLISLLGAGPLALGSLAIAWNRHR